jgi:hypothetical protein
MTNKLTMLTLAGALALSAVAPSAMAVSNEKGAAARRPNSVTNAKATSVKVATKKSAGRAAVPPHTILNGAKDNPF